MGKSLIKRVGGSFRDPSGFLYRQDGMLFRNVCHSYKSQYDSLMKSGLYESLAKENLLVSHVEHENIHANEKTYKIICPERIELISYPYEWCFGQLKDAALLTLKIQSIALKFNMTLKDGSAYNVQFRRCRPVFIDTLSFEHYIEGRPWIAYGQFCRHFLAPLVLMKFVDHRLAKLLKQYLDGIPLDLASKLLPPKTFLNLSILSHIHLHSRAEKHFERKKTKIADKKVGLFNMLALIDNLISFIENLNRKHEKSEWGNYYEDTNYSDTAAGHKKELVGKFLDKTKARTVWDIGGNNGYYSKLAADRNISTVCFDNDFEAVEKNYSICKHNGRGKLLPLIMDIANPSSAIGWGNEERMSLIERGPADCVFALALIHHLAIANNIPFVMIAGFFAKICKDLIIEFVPKTDSNVQRMLKTRADIFVDYNEQGFDKAFGVFFDILIKEKISGSDRMLYLMRKRHDI